MRVNFIRVHDMVASNFWLIKNVIPSDSICLINGDSAELNALTASYFSLNIATGHNWQGKKIKPESVIYGGSKSSPMLTNAYYEQTYTNYCREACYLHLCDEGINLNRDVNIDDLCGNITQYAKKFNESSKPVLLVIDLDYPSLDETSVLKYTKKVLHNAYELRAMIGVSILFVNMMGDKLPPSALNYLSNDIDMVVEAKAINNSTNYKISYLKMRNFSIPDPLFCVNKLQEGGEV